MGKGTCKCLIVNETHFFEAIQQRKSNILRHTLLGQQCGKLML